MHDMERKKRRQLTALTKLCRLAELGKCKKRFKPKVRWQDFCETDHQQLYWKMVRKEKRMAAVMLSDHEKRITEHEQRIKKLEEEEENHGRK